MKTHVLSMALIMCWVMFFTAIPTFSVSQVHAYQSTVAKPLMIIRFNQKRVFYQKPLFNALSKAISIAPAAQFHLVSYVPHAGRADRDERALAVANQHLREVVGEMNKMGVPAGQVSVNNEMDSTLKYDEVHIFVR